MATDTEHAASFFGPRDAHVSRPVPTTQGLGPGSVLGDFTVLSAIGEGGMGQVWEAEQHSLGRRVALKVIRPDRIGLNTLELFAREARAGGRLAHPGLVAVYGHGEHEGIAWIAMEFVPGCWSLRDFLDDLDGAELPDDYYRHVATFVAQIADALEAAHGAGVIHRDLKPSNILIAPDDRPKITDFGLARLTDETALSRTGDFAGTYSYMSPEQVAARRMGLDHRSDIFSLGVVLYEMLALRRPFEGDTSHQIAEQILTHSPPDLRKIRSRIPADLAVICGKALEKDRNRRYSRCSELAADLRRHLANEPILAKPPGAVRRLQLWTRRHPAKSLAGAVGLAAAVGLAFAFEATRKARRDLASERVEQGRLQLEIQQGLLEIERKSQELQDLRTSAAKELSEAQDRLVTVTSALHQVERQADSIREEYAISVDELGDLRTVIAELEKRRAHLEFRESYLEAHLQRGARLRERIDGLLERAAQPWMLESTDGEVLEALVGEVESLVADLPELRATRDTLGASLEPTEEPSTPGSPSAGELIVQHKMHGELSSWIAEIETLADPEGGLLGDSISTEFGWGLHRRRNWLSRMANEFGPLGGLRQRWESAVPLDPYIYGEFELPIQWGLVPLGPDPETELHEYAHLASGSAPDRDAKGTLRITEASALVLVLVPGRFMDEVPSKEAPPFLIAKHGLTLAQWSRFMGDTPVGRLGLDGPASVLDAREDAVRLALDRMELRRPTPLQLELAAAWIEVGPAAELRPTRPLDD